jgi:hypothetical protein
MNSVTFGEQPSDKEELEAVLKNCPILTQDTIRIVEQANKIIALETENAKLKKAVEELRESLVSIALMPEYDQDDSHRLRNIAAETLKQTEGL